MLANTPPPAILELPPLFRKLCLGIHDAEEDDDDLMVQARAVSGRRQRGLYSTRGRDT